VEKYTKRSNNRQPMNYSSNDEGGSGLGTLGDVFGDLFKK
jgi:small subunit ribosomal protein S1